MKSFLVALIVAGLFVVAAPKDAGAVGCVSGAIVGGAAGHIVHHGVLGAVGGCIAGHHAAVMQHRRERAAAAANQGMLVAQPR